MEPVLWLFVCIFFMISIFFFGAMVYFTIQRIRIIGVKKEVLAIDNDLKKIRGNVTRLLNQFQRLTKNK